MRSHRASSSGISEEATRSAIPDAASARVRWVSANGLVGAIPAALPMVALVTAPFIERYPASTVTVWSLSSIDIQRGLDDFTIDAGITYLDNEPLSHVRSVPLYREHYVLITPADLRSEVKLQ